MQQTYRREDEAEKESVRLAQGGDRSAMQHLYCRYVRYLTAVCSRYIIGDEDIKDALQESFVKIFSSISRFEYRGEGSLKAWMTRIVVNEALRFLKRESNFASMFREESLPDVVDDTPDDVEDIPQSVIHEMIRRLPTGYRTIFNLYVFERKTHKEIAAILHIGESSSASQLHRAKAILARQIREYRKKLREE
jgi:RNA polymerase sigma-70 factor (ECF subfamily)